MSEENQTTDPKPAKKTGRKPSAKARNMSARLLASQAVYQCALNGQKLRDAAQEYLDHRIGMTIEEEEIVEPNRTLFTKIMNGVADRKDDLSHVIGENLSLSADKTDPLIKSILICAAFELLAHDDIDSPIIINDYLNVANAFFEKGQVGLINGVLDSVAKAFR